LKYSTLFSGLILALILIDAKAELPTYNGATLPTITECKSGIFLKVQTDGYNTGGDPKLRPKGKTSGYAEFDPIKKAPSHLHVFSGPCDFTINSSRSSLINSTMGTTDGGQIDNTLVWSPALIDTRNGQVLKPLFFETYYSRAFTDAKAHLIEKTPKGLVFIAGNHLATTYTDNEALAPQRGVFQCSTVTSGLTDKQDSFPLCATNAQFTIKLTAPQCVADDGNGVDTINSSDNMLIAIDGKIYLNTTGGPGLLSDGKHYIVGGNALMDSTDHQSHLAYPRTGSWTQNANECPSTHPHRVPQNALIVVYKITDSTMMPYLKLSSDSGQQGASAHWDYMEGWHRMFYDIFYNGCIRAGIDCGNTKLGNGWQLVNPNSAVDKALSE